MDPSTIQAMLVQQLGNRSGQPGTVGGGSSPQMQGQTSGANLMAQLAQKAMLMKALQGAQAAQQTQQANAMLPGSNAQVTSDPAIQALQQSPQNVLSPAQLQQLQQTQLAAPGGVPQQ
jgi:hypothetical protein